MSPLGPRLVILVAVVLGGGSLLPFAYFLLVGPPIAFRIADSDAARLAVDGLLCLGFFLQHSGMIRRDAKARVARRFGATYQPAVYAIASGAALLAVVLLWQPTDRDLLRLPGSARWVSAGVVLLAAAGFVWGVRALGAFDPLGARPIEAALRGRPVPSLPFSARGPYRYVRHPLYLVVLVLIWAHPHLSTDRLLFDVLWSAWIVVGTVLEERDLVAEFGETYRAYQRSVPMLVPLPGRVLPPGGVGPRPEESSARNAGGRR